MLGQGLVFQQRVVGKPSRCSRQNNGRTAAMQIWRRPLSPVRLSARRIKCSAWYRIAESQTETILLRKGNRHRLPGDSRRGSDVSRICHMATNPASSRNSMDSKAVNAFYTFGIRAKFHPVAQPAVPEQKAG